MFFILKVNSAYESKPSSFSSRASPQSFCLFTRTACKYFDEEILFRRRCSCVLLPTTKWISWKPEHEKDERRKKDSSLFLFFFRGYCASRIRAARGREGWPFVWRSLQSDTLNFEVWLNSREELNVTRCECREKGTSLKASALLLFSLSLHHIGSILYFRLCILCALQKNVLQCPLEALWWTTRLHSSPCWCEPVSLFQLLDWNEAFC